MSIERPRQRRPSVVVVDHHSTKRNRALNREVCLNWRVAVKRSLEKENTKMSIKKE